MISQRSVGRLQRLLRTFRYRGQQTIPVLDWPAYRHQLYEEGVDRHVLEHIEQEYNPEAGAYLPAIHDGTIPAYITHNDGNGQPVPNAADLVLGQELLKTFAEVALRRGLSLPATVPDAIRATNELSASLQIDGYEFVSGRLISATLRGMNLQDEDDSLIGLIRSINPSNLEEIRHHHREADETFVNGNWGSASNETRNFFVAVLRGLRRVATSVGGLSAFQEGNDTSLIENFRAIGFVTEHEKEAILKVWVLLSYSGPHVGIQDQDRARLTRLMVLGLVQWVCLKFRAWASNGFTPL